MNDQQYTVELFLKEAKHSLRSRVLTSFPPRVLSAVADEIERLRAELATVREENILLHESVVPYQRLAEAARVAADSRWGSADHMTGALRALEATLNEVKL